MQHPFDAVVVTVSADEKVSAFAQSASAPATANPATASPAAAVPVPVGKRMACQIASEAMTGQEKSDQIQLCMAQAQLDCLKQAIDQKIVGPQRREFEKSCAEDFGSPG